MLRAMAATKSFSNSYGSNNWKGKNNPNEVQPPNLLGFEICFFV